MVKTFALAAAVACVTMSAAGADAAAGAGKTRELRFMSYNIRHCCGADSKVSIPRVAEAIRRERPDFVGLQEVDKGVKRSGRKDQAAEIGKLTGLHATFAKAIPVQGGEYGNAVLSREKPLKTVRVALPGAERRVLLFCEFTNCWFGTMHLDLKPGKQMESVEKIRTTVEKLAASKPVVLTGDWNALPNSPTLGAFRKFMTVVSDEKHRTFHGFKKCREDGDCIDYIAVASPGAAKMSARDAHVTKNAVPSDHYPIAVAVKFP